MKIGVISDIHGSAIDFEKALKTLLKDKVYISPLTEGLILSMLGNSAYKSCNSKKASELINNFPKPFIIVKGNYDSADKLKKGFVILDIIYNKKTKIIFKEMI